MGLTEHSMVWSVLSVVVRLVWLCAFCSAKKYDHSQILWNGTPRSIRVCLSSLFVWERFLGPALVCYPARITRVFLKHKMSLAGWACVQPLTWMRLYVYISSVAHLVMFVSCAPLHASCVLSDSMQQCVEREVVYFKLPGSVQAFFPDICCKVHMRLNSCLRLSLQPFLFVLLVV